MGLSFSLIQKKKKIIGGYSINGEVDHSDVLVLGEDDEDQFDTSVSQETTLNQKINYICFTVDGRTLLAGHEDQQISIWNLTLDPTPMLIFKKILNLGGSVIEMTISKRNVLRALTKEENIYNIFELKLK